MTSDLRHPISDSPARVLIVDDHAIVRYGMGVLLSGADDLSLCGEADSYDEALTAIRELKPDVAVIDIILHNQSGLDLIRQLRAEGQTLPLLVLSMHNEATHAEKALRAGAQGYIMKEDADEVLVEALRTVLSGKLHISGNINEKMLRTYIEGDEEEQIGIDSLTVREKEIFECLGQGLTTRKIAEKFSLSPRTVEVHRARIKKKLACEDAAQLLRAAVQWVESGLRDT
ncbi:MAG: response regulator transcription factor [Verrucomicrobia bacterium]|nr:response regulator transcription factor [Verrucomicrobiota bacterium]